MKILAASIYLTVVLQAAEVSFSHKLHAALKLDCTYCHATAKTSERAGFPPAATCMVCHVQIAKTKPAIQRLSALPSDTLITPTRSMYMLAEFVFFSHAKHRAAQIACQRCHGNVWEQPVIRQAMPMTMKACISCHKTTHAKVGCNTCHHLQE